jgi:hypothetical protein
MTVPCPFISRYTVDAEFFHAKTVGLFLKLP